MSTITSWPLVEQLIANDGRYEDDPPVAFIVEYENAYGGIAWGVTWVTETPERQRRYLVATEYVRNPRTLYPQETPR